MSAGILLMPTTSPFEAPRPVLCTARLAPQGDGSASVRSYSQDQVEKSFSNWGTSFQTPFSFLLMTVGHCGWNR